MERGRREDRVAIPTEASVVTMLSTNSISFGCPAQLQSMGLQEQSKHPRGVLRVDPFENKAEVLLKTQWEGR